MSTKFFTNRDQDSSLLEKFEGIFKYQGDIRFFDALVGYFRASGYFKVRPFLEKLPKIRILVGINVDKLIRDYHERGQYYLENPDVAKDKFLQEIIENIQEADYKQDIETGIIQFIKDIINGKIEIRTHPKKKIHAKVYIFRPAYFNNDIKYICALLNSKLIYHYLWENSPKTGTGDVITSVQAIEPIPLPQLSIEDQQPFKELVDKILEAKKADPKADTGALEAEIDRLVYQLYELTEEEINIIEGSK